MSQEEKPKKVILDNNPLQEKQDEYNKQILKNSGVDLNSEIMKNLISNAAGAVKKSRSIPRLAFAEDPNKSDNYAGIYKLKRGLVPDTLIKQIRVQNFLIACILRARGNAMSMIGHIRKDRFDVGIEVEVKTEFKQHIEPEQMEKIQDRIDKFQKKLLNCGYTDGLEDHEKMTLPTFFYLQAQNGLSFGRFSTEIVRHPETGEFHRFRPTDAGTIYRTVRKGEAADGVRKSSMKMLEQLTGEKTMVAQIESNKYPWVQVIDGTPKQAFTSDEMLVYNLYPSTDVEHNGYPVTPIDTVMNSITTHMSIEVYSKLYFQNGRAARGILVVKAEDIDQAAIEDMKQQFNASINNVTNSFRTPIFGVTPKDDVQWVSTQPQRKDGEFQFLFDQTTRNILSAFNMSPDELPGFTHLSRGTNQQSLSEANNEYKLIAARDTGIRPLLLQFEAFLNEKIFPIMDKELSQLCDIKLAGFDALSQEQESVRLQTDSPIHYNYDEVMEKVDKDQVGAFASGKLPFNERYMQSAYVHNTVGEIDDLFRETMGASLDPLKKFKRDNFWFQWIQLLMEIDPIKVKALMSTRPDAIDLLKMQIEESLIDD
jgi:hypothetical protein